jgi:predicted nucleic acid-binding protein
VETDSRGARVLDSWALLASLLREPAAPTVNEMLRQASTGALALALSVVNAGEVFYRLARRHTRSEAEEYWFDLLGGELPIRVVPATTERVLQAARLKASYRLSYADAFAVALSRELNAPLATGDPELGRLAEQGVLVVDWLGS